MVGLCKVAPPSSLLEKLEAAEGACSRQRTPVREADARPRSLVDAQPRLVTDLLYLAASISGGTWTPVSEKDKELVLQILSISADLIQVGGQTLSRLQKGRGYDTAENIFCAA